MRLELMGKKCQKGCAMFPGGVVECSSKLDHDPRPSNVRTTHRQLNLFIANIPHLTQRKPISIDGLSCMDVSNRAGEFVSASSAVSTPHVQHSETQWVLNLVPNNLQAE